MLAKARCELAKKKIYFVLVCARKRASDKRNDSIPTVYHKARRWLIKSYIITALAIS